MATGLRGAGILTEGAMIVGIGMAGAPIMGLPQSPLPEPAAVGVAYVALLLLQGGGVHDQRQRVGLAVRALACTFVCMALIVSRG